MTTKNENWVKTHTKSDWVTLTPGSNHATDKTSNVYEWKSLKMQAKLQKELISAPTQKGALKISVYENLTADVA